MTLMKRFFWGVGIIELTLSTWALAEIKVYDSWIPEAPSSANVLAGYFKIENSGAKEVELVSATSPLAKHVEIHEMKNHDGMMHMQQMKSLVVPAGKTVALEPGGYHIMFIRPKRIPIKGEMIPLAITVSDGQVIKVDAEVRPR